MSCTSHLEVCIELNSDIDGGWKEFNEDVDDILNMVSLSGAESVGLFKHQETSQFLVLT